MSLWNLALLCFILRLQLSLLKKPPKCKLFSYLRENFSLCVPSCVPHISITCLYGIWHFCFILRLQLSLLKKPQKCKLFPYLRENFSLCLPFRVIKSPAVTTLCVWGLSSNLVILYYKFHHCKCGVCSILTNISHCLMKLQCMCVCLCVYGDVHMCCGGWVFCCVVQCCMSCMYECMCVCGASLHWQSDSEVIASDKLLSWNHKPQCISPPVLSLFTFHCKVCPWTLQQK